MKEFRGKVVVITGAAGGIGGGLAEAFAKEGARLVLADIAEAPLHAAAERLRWSGAEVLAVPTDVADSAAVDALAQAAYDTFGAVHILCSNAGVGQGMRPVWDFPLDYLQRFFAIDLWGVIHGIRSFAPRMLKQGGACHIVNTASMAGIIPYPTPYQGPYSAAKAAVIALTESLAADLQRAGSMLKTSVFCPGLVKTGILDYDAYPTYGLPVVEQTEQEMFDKWRVELDKAPDPATVAAQVLEGIRKEQLYILTAPEFNEFVASRAQDMVQKRNPTRMLFADSAP